MSEAVRRGLYIFVAALAVILGGVIYEQFWLGGAENAGPAVGGPFSLVDQDGATRRDSDFRGKVMLVYFGYTYCPDACPTTLQAISQTLDLLGNAASKVQPIFISVDPARDTPTQLKSYAANFHPGILYLTGAPDALKQAESEYHVYVAKVPQAGSDDYLIDHSSIIYVMGTDGRYLGEMPTGLPPKAMAATVQRYL
ncbi:MAG TPA: SCO family protein [Stellaceae bacterium]|jgi:protein SCO1/2